VGQEKFQSQPNNLQPSGKLAQQLPDFMLEKKNSLWRVRSRWWRRRRMLCFEVQVVVRLSLISLNSEELTLLVPEEEEVEKTCF
jgi:hypothetical protein